MPSAVQVQLHKVRSTILVITHRVVHVTLLPWKLGSISSNKYITKTYRYLAQPSFERFRFSLCVIIYEYLMAVIYQHRFVKITEKDWPDFDLLVQILIKTIAIQKIPLQQ